MCDEGRRGPEIEGSSRPSAIPEVAWVGRVVRKQLVHGCFVKVEEAKIRQQTKLVMLTLSKVGDALNA
jgi:hypothetical protein